MKSKEVEVSLDEGKYTFEFSPDVLDDVEFLEKFAAIQDGSNSDVVGMVKGLLGEECFSEIKNYYKKEHGRMRIADLTSLVEAVFSHFPKA